MGIGSIRWELKLTSTLMIRTNLCLRRPRRTPTRYRSLSGSSRAPALKQEWSWLRRVRLAARRQPLLEQRLGPSQPRLRRAWRRRPPSESLRRRGRRFHALGRSICWTRNSSPNPAQIGLWAFSQFSIRFRPVSRQVLPGFYIFL
jgi:hypothetical protein